MYSLKKYIQNGFIRNVTLVACGTAGAQIINFILSPILTRIYGPDAFGILGAFIAIIGLLTPIAAGCYPGAMVIPRLKSHVVYVATLSVVIVSIVCVSLFVCLFIFGDYLWSRLGYGAKENFFVMIPLAVLTGAILQIAQQALIRSGHFSFIARVAVLQAAIIGLFKVVTGRLVPTGEILVVSVILANVTHSIFLLAPIKAHLWELGGAKQKYMSLRRLCAFAVRYADFPQYRAPQMFINALSESLPVLLLSACAGAAYAGFYSLSQSVVGVPTSLIGNSIGDVFLSKIARAFRESGPVWRLFVMTTFGLSLVAFVPFSILVLFGPKLFGMIFGDEWVNAGVYARWLSIWMYFKMISNPSMKILAFINAQQFYLKFTFFATLVRLLLMLAAISIFEDPDRLVQVAGLSGAVTQIVFVSLVFFKVHEFARQRLEFK